MEKKQTVIDELILVLDELSLKDFQLTTKVLINELKRYCNDELKEKHKQEMIYANDMGNRNQHKKKKLTPTQWYEKTYNQ